MGPKHNRGQRPHFDSISNMNGVRRRYALRSGLHRQVVGITDGDTIRDIHDGAEEKTRLWGIDCLQLVTKDFGFWLPKIVQGLSHGGVLQVTFDSDSSSGGVALDADEWVAF